MGKGGSPRRSIGAPALGLTRSLRPIWTGAGIRIWQRARVARPARRLRVRLYFFVGLCRRSRWGWGSGSGGGQLRFGFAPLYRPQRLGAEERRERGVLCGGLLRGRP